MCSSLMFTLSWVLVLALISVLFFVLVVYALFFALEVSISLTLYSYPLIEAVSSVRLDVWSASFSLVVSVVSLVVFCFSYYYLQSYLKLLYFSWLTFSFVLSMLILINFDDLFFVMLGWDGLGIVSFFLIIYYQSPVSVFSGVFTFLMNRIGDGLFVVSIVLFSYWSLFLGYYSGVSSLSAALVLVVAFMTNSALFPFSPWLPAAMAAPTPISSLVHSSTLVTAGLYLMLRHTYIFHTSSVASFLLVVGIFTSFYAGLSSIFEADLNKVVALSTLSHLGFICTSLGLGWDSLAFFHLLSHALFKSSLFMALGSYIVSSSHIQDSRYMSSYLVSMPFASSVVFISESSLLGFPFFSGFYSNDFILEAFHYSSFSGVVVFVLFSNVFFTFSYSLRIVDRLVSPALHVPLSVLPLSSSYLFVIALFTLSFCSIAFGLLWSCLVDPLFMLVPFLFKGLPLFIMLFSVALFYLFPYNPVLDVSWAPALLLSLFSHMLYLVNFWSSFVAGLFTRLVSNINKSYEYGFAYYYVVAYPVSVVWRISGLLFYLFRSSFSLGMGLSILLGVVGWVLL